MSSRVHIFFLPSMTSRKCLLVGLTVLTVAFVIMIQHSIIFKTTSQNTYIEKDIRDLWMSLDDSFIRNSSVSDADVKATNDERVSSLQCVFPHANPFDEGVVKLAGLDQGALSCADHSPDLTYLAEERLVVNRTKVHELHGDDQVTCQYRDVFRNQYDDLKVIFGNWSDHFEEEIKLAKTTEFIHVLCRKHSDSVVSNSYYPMIPRREEFDEIYSIRFKKSQEQTAPKESLSVIMIGFDGVSRYQFLRAMKNSYSFLMGELGSFDMALYTQIGKDTFENYLGLYTGEPYQDTKKWWDFSKYTDDLDLVWQAFEKAGYRTLYTEDGPEGGAFHYQKKGFMSTPTSYYSRPITLAITHDKEIFKGGSYCVGNKPELVFHTDYVKRFFDTFPSSPLFSFTFLTRLTHDDMTNLKMVDDHLLNIYKELHHLGHLNRALLVTYSDHGPRMGSIRSSFNGMVESRTPYAIFTLPKWFLEKYPDVAGNLKTNTGRLTTHFDTHATLQDLIYFKGTGEIPLKPSKHGISLFREIPKNRTCEEIPIPPEFCLCNQKEMRLIDVNGPLAKTLADIVMVSLSSKINKSLCSNLNIDKILVVAHTELTETLSKESKNKILFKVRLQTVPGKGIFEATVFVQSENGRLHVSPKSVQVGELIERMNLYRGQAECVADPNQRLFCYCKKPFQVEEPHSSTKANI